MIWPQKIFIESTALFQLGPRLENVDFERLLELCKTLHTDVFITDVNFREYLRFRKREIRQTRRRIEEANRDLEKYGQNYGEFDSIFRQVDTFSPTIDKYFEERFQAIGIRILPLPEIDTKKLVKMSLEGTPPFEKPREHPNEKSSEKGFRDAVIMFTILQEVEDRPDDSALVITGDDLLTSGFLLHAPEFGTVVNCVDGIPTANKFIERQLSASYREHLREESEEAKAVLFANKEALEAKVAEIREIEPMDFGGLFGVIKDENDTPLSLQRVLSVQFEDIEAAVWKDRDQPRSKILFRVKCQANVVVRNPYFPMFGYPKYPIGSPAVYSKVAQSPETFEKAFPLWFYGQATVIKKDATWILEDLRIDRTMPDKEDFYELMRVTMPGT